MLNPFFEVFVAVGGGFCAEGTRRCWLLRRGQAHPGTPGELLGGSWSVNVPCASARAGDGRKHGHRAAGAEAMLNRAR